MVSKNILNELHNTPNFNDFNNIKPIPEIDYNDPLQIITGEAKGIIKKDISQQQNDYITVKDGDKSIKLPKLKQVNPHDGDINKYLQNLSTKDLLIEIYKMQKEILKEFNKR